MLFTSALTAVVALLPLALASSTPAYDDQSLTLYVTEPSCDSYKCKVNWTTGKSFEVNWLNSPKGYVRVQLESETTSTTYVLASKVLGTMPIKSCNGGNGVGKKGRPCGAITVTVPSTWKSGEYTVAVHSLSYPDKIGYTDTVVIDNSKKTTAPVSTTCKRTSQCSKKGLPAYSHPLCHKKCTFACNSGYVKNSAGTGCIKKK